MKICHTVVMVPQIRPDSHGVFFSAIKRAVHKLDLGHPLIQEKLQFVKDQREASEPQLLVNG